MGLRQFGNMGRIKLDPPADLRELVTLAVEIEEGTERSRLTKPQIVDVSAFTHILSFVILNVYIKTFSV